MHSLEQLRAEYAARGQTSRQRSGDAASPTKTFKLYKQSTCWGRAWQTCQSTGGNLATVRSQEENAKIRQLLSACPGQTYEKNLWLGGRSRLYGENWQWTWVRCGPQSTYSNWSPNSTHLSNTSNGHCLAMSPQDGHWDGESCGIRQYFVCEYYNQAQNDDSESSGASAASSSSGSGSASTSDASSTGAESNTLEESETGSENEEENENEIVEPEGLDVRKGRYCTTDSNQSISNTAFHECDVVEIGAVGDGWNEWFPEYIFPNADEVNRGKLVFVNHLASESSTYTLSGPNANIKFKGFQGDRSCWQSVSDGWNKIDLLRCLALVQEYGLQVCEVNSFEECDVIKTTDLSEIPKETLDAVKIGDGKRIYMLSDQQQGRLTPMVNMLTMAEPNGCWMTVQGEWKAVGSGKCLRGLRLPELEYQRLVGVSSADEVESNTSGLLHDGRVIGVLAASAVVCLATVILIAVAIKTRGFAAQRQRRASEPYMQEADPVVGLPVETATKSEKDVEVVLSDPEDEK